MMSLTVLQRFETAMAYVAVGAAGLPSVVSTTPRGVFRTIPPDGHPQHLFISCESAWKLGSKSRKGFQLLLDNKIHMVKFYNSSRHNARSRGCRPERFPTRSFWIEILEQCPV